MKLAEPFTLIISNKSPSAFFKTKDGKYLSFNGFQVANADESIKDYTIIKEREDILPFIILHNAHIDAIKNGIFVTSRVCGKRYLLDVLEKSYIDNELNTDLTIEDICEQYDDGIITYDYLHIWLMMDMLRKYNNKI